MERRENEPAEKAGTDQAEAGSQVTKEGASEEDSDDSGEQE